MIMDPTPSRPRPTYRRRGLVNCRVCRKRKIRCDRAKPCGHCVKAGHAEQCIYDPPLEIRRPDAAAAVVSPVNPSSLAAKRQEPGSSRTEASQSLPTGHLLSSQADASSFLHLLWRGSRAVDNYHEPFNDRRLWTAKEVIRGENDSTTWWGRSHGSNFIPCFTDIINFLLKSDEQDDVSTLYQLERRTRPRDFTSLVPVQAHDPELYALLPPRPSLDQYVQTYFKYFESYYRILHVPTFLADYARLWDETTCTSGPPHLLPTLLGICAVSCSFSSVDEVQGSINKTLVLGWIEAVRSWLSKQETKIRKSLGYLQTYFLMLISWEANWIHIDQTWVASGNLVRTAISAGLHREPSDLVRISPFYAELRRRLWYSILEFDLQASLSKGTIPSVSETDYDCSLPSDIDDAQLFGGPGVVPAPLPSNPHTPTKLQILLARSLPLRSKICRLANSIEFDQPYEKVLKLDAELRDFLGESSTTLNTEAEPFRRVLFSILIRRALIALNRPFASRAAHDPRYFYSRQACNELAITILNDALSLDVDQFSALANICRTEISAAAFLLCHELLVAAVEQQQLFAQTPSTQQYVSQWTYPRRDMFLDLIDRTASALMNVSTDTLSQRICGLLHLVAGVSRATAEGGDTVSAMRTSLQQSIQAYRSSLQTTEICPTSDLEASSQAQQTAVRAPDEDNYFNMDFTTAPVNDFTPWFLSPFLFNSLESLNNTTQRL